MWSIKLPTYLTYGKKDIKKFPLNINAYRNAHHQLLNNMKVNFTELVTPSIIHLPQLDKIRISYYLYTGSKTLCDTSNITSIVNKFFCDTLVRAGKLPDDNYNHVLGTADMFGGIVKGDPHVEAIIESL